jgi:hypothetical protein
MRLLRYNRGFAVREVTVVVLLLAAIGGTLLGRITGLRAEVAATACHQNATEINIAIDRWRVEKGRWPAQDLSDIASDPSYFPDGIPRCPVTGEEYKMDPQTHRVGRSHRQH